MSFESTKNYLAQFNLDSKVKVFNESSATVELAAKAIGCEEKQIAKTMSFDVNNKPILIVLSGDSKVDNSKFKSLFHTKATMIKIDELEEKTGHKIGGVCPFNNKEDVQVYLDESLKRFEYIYPACGSANSVVKLTLPELEQTSKAIKYIDVSKGWQ